MLQKSHNRIGIIGGTNGTGKQFAILLAKLGFSVQVSGRKTKITNSELAQNSDILLFAPPLKNSVKIIQETVPFCQNPKQIIADLCSLKTSQIKAMTKAKGEIIGLHPLFGPHFQDVNDQDLIVCRNKKTTNTTKLIKLLKNELGLKIHEMSAKEHDQLMSIIQVIPHLSALISGSLFRALKIHPELSLKICSPVYKAELYMIGRIYSQNPELYASIIGGNPHSKKIANTLKKTIDDLIPAISYQDIESLSKNFTQNKKHFGEFSQIALAESQKLLKNL